MHNSMNCCFVYMCVSFLSFLQNLYETCSEACSRMPLQASENAVCTSLKADEMPWELWISSCARIKIDCYLESWPQLQACQSIIYLISKSAIEIKRICSTQEVSRLFSLKVLQRKRMNMKYKRELENSPSPMGSVLYHFRIVASMWNQLLLFFQKPTMKNLSPPKKKKCTLPPFLMPLLKPAIKRQGSSIFCDPIFFSKRCNVFNQRNCHTTVLSMQFSISEYNLFARQLTLSNFVHLITIIKSSGNVCVCVFKKCLKCGLVFLHHIGEC